MKKKVDSIELKAAKREIARLNKVAEGQLDGPTTPPNFVPLSAATQAIVFLNWHRYASIVMKLTQQVGIAHRIHSAIRNYVLGLGVTKAIKVTDPKLKGIEQCLTNLIESFWNDPRNNVDLQIHDWIYEHSCLGEVCIPVVVEEHTGKVYLQNLPCIFINEVVANQWNTRDAIRFSTSRGEWRNHKRNKFGGKMHWEPGGKFMDVIRYNDKPYETELDPNGNEVTVRDNEGMAIPNPDLGMLTGEAFYWRSGNTLGSNRGFGDTVQVIELIQAFDQFLFDSMNRLDLQSRIVWDVTVDGNDEAVKKWQNIPIPQATTFLAHNKKVVIEPKAPAIKVEEFTAFTRFLRELIAGSAGFPEMAMGYAGDTNVATAKEQSSVMYAEFNNRRNWWAANLKMMIRFVVEQANKAGMIHDDKGATVKLTRKNIDELDLQCGFTGFESSDIEKLSASMANLANGLLILEQNKIVDPGVVRQVVSMVFNQFGIDTSQESIQADVNEDLAATGASGLPTNAKDLAEAMLRPTSGGMKPPKKKVKVTKK